MIYNEQNQLLRIKKLLKDNKIEQGIRLADQLIKQKYKPKELHALIKKTLIKKKILNNDPNISKLGQLIHQKYFTSAKYFFKHHLSALTKNSKSLFFAGKIFLELDEMDEAQKYFEEAIKVDPENLNIRKEISIFYMTTGKLEKAIENFNYIKKINPVDGENHRLLSRTKKYYSNDDIHIKEMEHLILNTELNKEQRININFALGNVYELQKKYRKSAKFYRVANSEQQSRLKYDYDKEKYIGSDENWDKAEKAIIDTAKQQGLETVVEYGEAAFYGPKLDFMVKDALGRQWQLGTIQVDYNLPERFELEYTGADNQKHRPVMIHRAPFGSMERFVSVLIEHCGGNFPLWLAPEQIVILPISEKYHDYANKVMQLLKNSDICGRIDQRSEKTGRKIRDAEVSKTPYMIIVGEKEESEGTVSVRKHGGDDLGSMKIDTLIDAINKEIEEITKFNN